MSLLSQLMNIADGLAETCQGKTLEQDSFPILLIVPERNWELEARLSEESKDEQKFILLINGKIFADY